MDPIIISLLIFLARVADVTFGTLRTVAIIRGEKFEAFILSFLEVIIWVYASVKVINNFDNFIYPIAYSLGYATGVYVGLTIESKISNSERIIHFFSFQKNKILEIFSEFEIKSLNSDINGFTTFHLKIKKSLLSRVITKFKEADPQGYYFINEAKLNVRLSKQRFWKFSFRNRFLRK